MLPECCADVPRMLPECFLNLPTMLPECSQNLPTMFPSALLWYKAGESYVCVRFAEDKTAPASDWPKLPHTIEVTVLPLAEVPLEAARTGNTRLTLALYDSVLLKPCTKNKNKITLQRIFVTRGGSQFEGDPLPSI